MRKRIEQIDVTPKLKEHYKKVKVFCVKNNIPFKLVRPIGLSVDIRNIPNDKVDEWIEITRHE